MELQDVPGVEGRRPSIQGLLERWVHWNQQLFERGSLQYDHFSWHLPPGGRVIFNVANDSPTLTGAKVTFTINLEFPHNQKLLPNGDVVWAEDCVFNGEEPSRYDADTHSVSPSPHRLLSDGRNKVQRVGASLSDPGRGLGGSFPRRNAYKEGQETRIRVCVEGLGWVELFLHQPTLRVKEFLPGWRSTWVD